jgi:hypothetical protein
MARPNKKTVNEEAEDEPPLGEDRGLIKDVSQDANSSKTSKLKNKDSKNLKNKF